MARIAGINIPPQQHAEIGLTAIFGIGRTRARKICEACDIAYSKKVKDLTDGDLEKIRDQIAQFTIEGDLRRETADNLKKSGAFIPGIRPGDQTARYIDKILVRLTLAGAVYITFVCLLPEFLILKYNVPFYFGGTSLLIIVVVTMDFMAQVQNYLMSQQYESLLKKANFKTSLGG